MAPKCSILSSLFVVMIMSQNLQIIEGRNLSFHRQKYPTEKRVSRGQYGISETNQMKNALPTALMEATPGPAAMLPGPPPAPPAPVGGAPGHAENFRPTTPGRSPGIGNFIQN
ncbi:hypothetical protein ACH5RR_014082 [Cinchona calisaya]|uniref:Uncharacterized protein n=1 Tax=Cinchona calisaya TaxID=153742 RepID=A0ABD3A1V3_9GENT